MAAIKNPRKGFNFKIEIAGAGFLNSFLFQDVELGEIEIEAVPHGDTNHDVNTAGRVKYGNTKLQKLLTTTPTDKANQFFFDWGVDCADGMTGGGLPPATTWKDIYIYELAEDNRMVLNTWVLYNCWPTRINGQSFKRMEGANSLESLEIVNEVIDKL